VIPEEEAVPPGGLRTRRQVREDARVRKLVERSNEDPTARHVGIVRTPCHQLEDAVSPVRHGVD
jgi:hypothetical protein